MTGSGHGLGRALKNTGSAMTDSGHGLGRAEEHGVAHTDSGHALKMRLICSAISDSVVFLAKASSLSSKLRA